MSVTIKREKHRLVGAAMSLHFSSYLTLYSLAKGISKSDIIRTKLENWQIETEEQCSEQYLVNECARRLYGNYKAELTFNPDLTYEKFKTEARQQLRKLRLGERLINNILTVVKESYATDKNK